MSKIIEQQGLTYDDVLLIPRKSVGRRSDRDLTTQLHPHLSLSLPIISSPMDTVTTDDMCVAMAQMGGLGIIHRSLTGKQQADLVKSAKSHDLSKYEGATV